MTTALPLTLEQPPDAVCCWPPVTLESPAPDAVFWEPPLTLAELPDAVLSSPVGWPANSLMHPIGSCDNSPS